MKAYPTITISRQYGSGGRKIGKLVAEKLGIPFYDKELIALAAKKSGISEELFEKVDEHAAGSLLYSMVLGSYDFGAFSAGTPNLPLNDKLFLIQSDLIKEAVKKGPCVIIGRCANYILQDVPRCLNIFIHAQKEVRIKRIVEEYGEPEKTAAAHLAKQDKIRASYYNFYTNEAWSAPDNYHLSLNSGKFGIDACVALICDAANRF